MWWRRKKGTADQLINAARDGDFKSVRALVQGGADVNAKDNNGWTALICAASGGHMGMVQYLVEKGADVNSKDGDGYTALMWAYYKGHMDVVQYLVEKGADAKALLMRFIREENFDRVKWLLEQNVPADFLDDDGNSVLPILLQHTNDEEKIRQIAKLLLEHGAPPIHSNNQGQSAKSIARKKGFSSIMDLIDEYAAKPRQRVAFQSEPEEENPSWLILPDTIARSHRPFANGGFGVVYRAKWKDAKVVVKDIEIKSPDEMKMFQREVSMWSKLRHKNIVTFYGANHREPPYFMVSSYASNGTLREYLSKRRDGESIVWRKLLEVAVGLKFLHSREVIHGDLKGDNIVVDEHGTAMLTHFGLSFLDTGSRRMIERLGAMQWRAPEYATGTVTRPSYESDVYSFGMCIIEAVKGTTPWGGHIDQNTVRELLRHEEIKVERPESMTIAQWTLVQRMTAYRRSDRPKLDEVIGELDKFADEEEDSQWGEEWQRDCNKQPQLFLDRVNSTTVKKLTNELKRSEKLEEVVALLDASSNGSAELVTLKKRVSKEIKRVKPEMKDLRVFDWFITAEDLLIENEIGTGTFGTVRRGVWVQDGESNRVIVKELFPKVSSKVDESFAEQLSSWKAISEHPNILKLHGGNHLGSRLFYVCEDTEGDLLDFLSDKTNRPAFWPMFLQVAEALRFLHARNIVHGGLKCSNIRMHNSPPTVKLTDFGFSDARIWSANLATEGKEAQHCSIRWQPTEVLEGVPIDDSFKSDVYSLGMCIIEAFTGEYPFLSYSSDIGKVVELILRGESHPRPHGMALAEWDLVRRMCTPECKARPSLDEVIEAIQGLVGEKKKSVIGEYEEHKTEDDEPDFTEEKFPAEEAKQTEPTESPEEFRLIPPNQLPTLLERCTGRFVVFCAVISRMMNLPRRESFRQADSDDQEELELELIQLVDSIATSRYGTFVVSSTTKQGPNFDAEKLTFGDLAAVIELGVVQVPRRARYVFETHERLSDAVDTFLRESIPISDWRSSWEEDCRAQVRYFSGVLGRELVQSATAIQKLSASGLLKALDDELQNRASLTQEEFALMEKARDVVQQALSVDDGNQSSTAAEFSRLVPRSDLPKIHLKDLKKVVSRRGSDYLSALWLNTPVTLKKVLGNVRLLGEAAKRWYNLSHPHILSLYGVCTERSGDVHFVMEDHIGGGLFSYPHDGFWGSVQALALALQFLHDQSIVHGNVNRENICMIGHTAKLRGIELITPIGEIVGASASSSPTQSRIGLSFATDVQAFGRCILEAITSSSSEETLSQLREGRLPSLPSEPTEEEWSLVSRMCSPEVEEQVTIQEVVARVSTFAEDEVRKGRDISTPLEKSATVKALTPQDCAKHLRCLINTNPSSKVLAGRDGGHDPDGGGNSSDESSDEDSDKDSNVGGDEDETNTDHDSDTEDGGDQGQMDDNENPNSGDGSDDKKNDKPEDGDTNTKVDSESASSETTCDDNNSGGGAGDDDMSGNNPGDGRKDEKERDEDDAEDGTDSFRLIHSSELTFNENERWIGARYVLRRRGLWNGVRVLVEKLQCDESQLKERTVKRIASLRTSLRHPNVHRCFGISHDGYSTLFICEMPEDGNLKEYLQSPNHESEVWRKMLDVALAFQHLHSRGIVHGDLYWDHLIVGGGGKAWLTGFMTSSKKASAVPFRRPERSRWTAPECSRDENPSAKADIYSLGRCIVDAVSGYFQLEDAEVCENSNELFYRPDKFSRLELELVSSMCLDVSDRRVSMSEVVDSLSLIVALHEVVNGKYFSLIEGIKTTLREEEGVTDADRAIQSVLLHEMKRVKEEDEAEYRRNVDADWEDRALGALDSEDEDDGKDIQARHSYAYLVEGAVSELRGYNKEKLCAVYRGTRTHNGERIQISDECRGQINTDDDAAGPTCPIWHIAEEAVRQGEKIGSGGYGIVYSGWWGRTQVAIKVVDKSKWSAREVELWYPLCHPHIISLFGACDRDENPFFVFAYAENGDSTKILKRAREAKDRATMWRILCEAALGLKYLHDQKIAHADFKCDNILVNAIGRAMVSDFGLSFKVGALDDMPARSGAIAWQAPEMMAPGQGVGCKADVYSLGMCIIEALTGFPPWKGVPPEAIPHHVLKTQSLPNMSRDPFSGLERAVVTGMCKNDPEKRYNIDKAIQRLQALQRNSMATVFQK